MGILGKGREAVRRAKVESDRNQAAFDGMRVRDLVIKPGEECVGYFNGTSDEPVVAEYHVVNFGGKKFRTWLCASGFANHDGCVLCWATKHGDKRVGKKMKQAVWNYVDARWVHKRKNKEKSAETGFDRFDFFPCKGEVDDEEPAEDCKYCLKDIPRVRQGAVRARFSMTWANAITGLGEKLARRCLACGGKVTLTSYKNGKKEVVDLEDVDDPSEWTPVYECSKCDEPDPGSIFRYLISIQRNGAAKQTSYNFSKASDEPSLPDWLDEFEPADLEKTMVPMSADKMAEELGIDNPFDGTSGKRKGAKNLGGSDYGADMPDADIPDDEEGEEKPSRIVKVTGKIKVRRPVVDDEDD